MRAAVPNATCNLEGTADGPQWRAAPGALSCAPRSLLLLLAALALVSGCEGKSTKTVTPPQARFGKPAEDEAESDVLPPQSEPPVADAADHAPAETEPKSPEESPPQKTARVLFDGTSLDNWERSNFGGEGEVEVVDGTVVMQRGSDLTGIHWTGDPLPKINYEVTLEAQRIDGSDFFCGIIFPYKDDFCSFVAGGWGGSLVGLSSVDGMYAAENDTGTYAMFEDKKWYKFRLRVSEHAVTVWIDGKEYVHLETKNRKLTLHPMVEPNKPFGICCYATVAGVRDIQLRELTEEEVAADGEEDGSP